MEGSVQGIFTPTDHGLQIEIEFTAIIKSHTKDMPFHMPNFFHSDQSLNHNFILADQSVEVKSRNVRLPSLPSTHPDAGQPIQ